MRLLFLFLLFSLALMAQPLEKIILQLQWKHQFEFAGFYMAKEKGFYKEAGLDVAFVEYDGKGDIGQRVLDLNLFTTKFEAQNNPIRVKKFKEASIRGWEYALKHKEETINIIQAKYNTQNKTKAALLFEAKQIEQIMLPSIQYQFDLPRESIFKITPNLADKCSNQLGTL